eukprot:1185203-Prorocentrum_minimum.AAC.2
MSSKLVHKDNGARCVLVGAQPLNGVNVEFTDQAEKFTVNYVNANGESCQSSVESSVARNYLRGLTWSNQGWFSRRSRAYEESSLFSGGDLHH